jgi:uncharacterized protein HemX
VLPIFGWETAKCGGLPSKQHDRFKTADGESCLRSEFSDRTATHGLMENITMLVTTMTKTNATTILLLAAMTLLLAITVPVFAQGQDQADSTHEMKVPETAKDHHQMAEHYQKIKAQTRQEIEMHEKMLVEFSKTAVKNPKAGENPYVKNMRLHCEKYIKPAEGLATEAAESAKFHTLRAKELEGK